MENRNIGQREQAGQQQGGLGRKEQQQPGRGAGQQQGGLGRKEQQQRQGGQKGGFTETER